MSNLMSACACVLFLLSVTATVSGSPFAAIAQGYGSKATTKPPTTVAPTTATPTPTPTPTTAAPTATPAPATAPFPANPAAIAALVDPAHILEPIVLVNLLKFKLQFKSNTSITGSTRYDEYSVAIAPLLAKVGGTVSFAGSVPIGYLIGQPSSAEQWDAVISGSYPSRLAFLSMISSPEYKAIEHLRDEALDSFFLIPVKQFNL